MTEIERRLKAVLDHELDSWDDKDIERIAGDLAAAVGAGTTAEAFGLRNPRTNEVVACASREEAVIHTADDRYQGWDLVRCVVISGCTPWETVR